MSLHTIDAAPLPAAAAPSMIALRDSHGRCITDLRLSVTDRCNFRCTYCLEPGTRFLPRMQLLHRSEYLRVVQASMSKGVRTLRLTGGEPTLYPELEALIGDLGQLGLDDMAMTTNGWSLSLKQATAWRHLGLRRLTFSLDTLDESNMRAVTRSSTTVAEVLRSIETAREAGFPRPKVNMVLMKGCNDHEVVAFAQLARERDLNIRFIEFMPLGSARNWSRQNVVTADEARAAVERRWSLVPVRDDAAQSTSVNWNFADGCPGRLGFIAPVSRPFCGACNRLRITAEGMVRPCLFSHAEWDLRPLLRSGESQEALGDFLVHAAWNKPIGHGIGQDGFHQPERSMSAIGG